MTIDKKVPQTPKALFSIPSKFANWLWQTSEFPKDMYTAIHRAGAAEVHSSDDMV